MALAHAGWPAFPARQQAARQQGRHLGIGLANFVKGTGRGPFESASVRIGPSGKVQIASGAAAMGQGTKTMLAQIVGAALGVSPADIAVTTGDTAAVALGIGGFNSRQAVLAGASAHQAALAVRDKALAIGAHLLEAAAADLELSGGAVRVKAAPQVKATLAELARAVTGVGGFPIAGNLAPGLAAEEHVVIDAMTYANGSAVAEIELDDETGRVTLRNLVIVHDCGRVLHPQIVDGQVLGGAAHGIGNALFEWMGYDDAAQPVTTNFGEYLLPSAPELPAITILHHESPTPLNPLGVKGVGECGVLAVPAAIVSAIEDALGIEINQAPIRPHEIVALINRSRSTR
jgi:carbon-monoxide dehydrogenase large subunit